MPGRCGFAHEAELILGSDTDSRAPGGAVTVALCGSWDHAGPCPWPHNNAIDTSCTPAVFRTVFVCTEDEAIAVRDAIDNALRHEDRWTVVTSAPRSLTSSERALASRLGAPSDEGLR